MQLELDERLKKGKVSIIGVGNMMLSDDAAGPVFIQRLENKIAADLIDAGEVPEDYWGKIVDSKSDIIVFIDAVDFGANAGDVGILESESVKGMTLSTHRVSLGTFMELVKSQTGADVFLVGIQPKSISFGEGVSREVEDTLEIMEELFKGILPVDFEER